MPQVPYNPLSQVEDTTGRPQSFVRVDAPLAAFGGTVADATKGLGQTFQNVGSELYDRAVAMQTVNEQAKATKATADFVVALGERFAQYKSLQGSAAVAGYKPFIEDLTKLREQQRQTLTSPYAQRAYDNETRNQQARTVFSAAGHSAEQNKTYFREANQAAIAANSQRAMADPNDDASYRQSLADNANRIRQDSIGVSEEAVELRIRMVNSELTRKRIEAVAATDPMRARSMANEALRANRLVGDDIAKVNNFVHAKSNQIGSREIARGVVSGEDLTVGERIVSNDQAAEAISGFGTNARNPRSVEPGKAENNSLLGKYRVAEQNLPQMLKDAGMPAMTKDEFLANPGAQDQLFKTTFGKLMKDKGSFNAAYAEWAKMNPGKVDVTPEQLLATNGRLAKRMTRSELDAVARERAAKLDPSNPDLPDLASQQTDIRRTRQIAQEREQETRNRNIIVARFNERGEDGKLISSEEELLNTPERKAAWDNLSDKAKKEYLDQLKANARGGYPATDENQAKYAGLRGAMTNPNLTVEERDELLQMDMGALKMPAQQRQVLVDLQTKMFREAVKAPNTNAAMRMIDPELRALGITPQKNKDDYNIFRGTMQGIIQDRMEELKRPLKPEEMRQIGKDLLRERAYKAMGGYGWNTKDNTFRAPVPPAEIEPIKQTFLRKEGREPSDDEIKMIYNRILAARNYQQLFGKPKIPDRAQ